MTNYWGIYKLPARCGDNVKPKTAPPAINRWGCLSNCELRFMIGSDDDRRHVRIA
ncbi:hypothetical protein QUF58_02795 [Anaerolineales bacterium HSG24]|nr:hypothetical protein [Anaerolineales bacterium HSG24]